MPNQNKNKQKLHHSTVRYVPWYLGDLNVRTCEPEEEACQPTNNANCFYPPEDRHGKGTGQFLGSYVIRVGDIRNIPWSIINFLYENVTGVTFGVTFVIFYQIERSLSKKISIHFPVTNSVVLRKMSHMGHNSKVPIRVPERYLQLIMKFAKCGPPCEGRGKWFVRPVRTDP